MKPPAGKDSLITTMLCSHTYISDSIDAKTEDTMQRLIRRKFSNHTIIAVAHRIETIMDFDKVAVLDAGRLVEFDSPYNLLEVPGSAFGKLYNTALAEEEEQLDEKSIS
jgi:ABC-type transport system involved in Fe-S cluster assembly fused permease/ATPase subunit